MEGGGQPDTSTPVTVWYLRRHELVDFFPDGSSRSAGDAFVAKLRRRLTGGRWMSQDHGYLVVAPGHGQDRETADLSVEIDETPVSFSDGSGPIDAELLGQPEPNGALVVLVPEVELLWPVFNPRLLLPPVPRRPLLRRRRRRS